MSRRVRGKLKKGGRNGLEREYKKRERREH